MHLLSCKESSANHIIILYSVFQIYSVLSISWKCTLPIVSGI